MLLAVDIGNTNITIGVFYNIDLKYTWRIYTKEDMTEDEYFVLINEFLKEAKLSRKEFEGIVISSVVPPLEYVFKKMAQKYFNLKPLILGAGIKTGMSIATDNPREVGADLIAGAVAAFNKYKQALIAVDFGTATTFSAVSSDGEFLGVSIAPGVIVSIEALYKRASKLPKIELQMPKRAIGKNTTESMLSGIVYGAFGQVEYIIKKMKKEMEDKNVLVVAIGGLSKFFEGKLSFIDKIEPDLILDGLRLIYEINRR